MSPAGQGHIRFENRTLGTPGQTGRCRRGQTAHWLCVAKRKMALRGPKVRMAHDINGICIQNPWGWSHAWGLWIVSPPGLFGPAEAESPGAGGLKPQLHSIAPETSRVSCIPEQPHGVIAAQATCPKQMKSRDWLCRAACFCTDGCAARHLHVAVRHRLRRRRLWCACRRRFALAGDAQTWGAQIRKRKR